MRCGAVRCGAILDDGDDTTYVLAGHVALVSSRGVMPGERV